MILRAEHFIVPLWKRGLDQLWYNTQIYFFYLYLSVFLSILGFSAKICCCLFACWSICIFVFLLFMYFCSLFIFLYCLFFCSFLQLFIYFNLFFSWDWACKGSSHESSLDLFIRSLSNKDLFIYRSLFLSNLTHNIFQLNFST